MPYIHYFDVRLSHQIASNKENFDDAIDEWINAFPSQQSLRKALLDSDESVSSIVEGIIHSDTDQLE